MTTQFSRTERLFGKPAMERLANARVAVFGIGGVGGYAVEALVRSGVGTIDLFDSDKICLTNLNRQIYATHRTIGRYKVDVAEERIRDINPEAKVNPHRLFYSAETAGQVDLSVYDYVLDAIDTITSKIELIVRCKAAGVPVISSMGAGNKIDAAAFTVADLYDTSVCPLARVMRRELRRRKIDSLKVVYSKEIPIVPQKEEPDSCLYEEGSTEKGLAEEGTAEEGSRDGVSRRRAPGSNAFVPSAAGMILAGEAIRDLIRASAPDQSGL